MGSPRKIIHTASRPITGLNKDRNEGGESVDTRMNFKKERARNGKTEVQCQCLKKRRRERRNLSHFNRKIVPKVSID